jgi:hypothetical protein
MKRTVFYLRYSAFMLIISSAIWVVRIGFCQPTSERDAAYQAVLWDYNTPGISHEQIIVDDIRLLLKSSDKELPDSMIALLEKIALDTLVDVNGREAAIWGLGIVGESHEIGNIRFLLNDSESKVQSAAAGVLVRWGYWEEGSGVLVENQDWLTLVSSNMEQAESLIRRAAETETGYSQLKAAVFLDYYGDDETGRNVARSVLGSYVLSNQEENLSSDQLKSADVGFGLLAHGDLDQEINLMKEGIRHPSHYVRTVAFGALATRARDGDASARDAILDASQNSSYDEIRERAANMVKH